MLFRSPTEVNKKRVIPFKGVNKFKPSGNKTGAPIKSCANYPTDGNKVAKNLKDALKKGLINYSKLARQIADDMNIELKNFDAILIACRRYYRKVKGEKVLEEGILDVLKRSKVEVKNKIIAVVLIKKLD